ncbi:uncharacterized protein LOC111041934 [Myzus persicae]|uniref:uncharacterized protein LOC111041934 n=1 Tax=Myzus persicae TaxID=13164 RepID=UPI000B93490A|nr:uncharacterized protein LOC111041934 [Myzus persicae]
MKAIIGLLHLSGSLRSSHQNLCDLWRTDGLGVDYFQATMNIRRFRFILQCLRFDNVNSRNTRIKTDRLASLMKCSSRSEENVGLYIVPLATELLKKHRITMVGTIRKNKREIPPNFCHTRGKIIQSNMFGFTKDMTLVSHVPKKSKIVLLLSTMHHDNAIDSNLNKPEIITFYNMTKGGVDVVDELKGNYSVARISRRWPLTIFYSLLNIAGINSQLIYKANNNCNINRREFLQTLGKRLTMGYLQQRTNIKTLPIEVKRKIASILGEKYIEQPNAGPTREEDVTTVIEKKIEKQKRNVKTVKIIFVRNIP